MVMPIGAMVTVAHVTPASTTAYRPYFTVRCTQQDPVWPSRPHPSPHGIGHGTIACRCRQGLALKARSFDYAEVVTTYWRCRLLRDSGQRYRPQTGHGAEPAFW